MGDDNDNSTIEGSHNHSRNTGNGNDDGDNDTIATTASGALSMNDEQQNIYSDSDDEYAANNYGEDQEEVLDDNDDTMTIDARGNRKKRELKLRPKISKCL